MRRYEYIGHTADVRLKVEADQFDELLISALEGMSNLIKEDCCQNFSKEDYNLENKIEVYSVDKTSLLIDFLSEVLTCVHVEKAIYCWVEFENLTDNFLKAKIFGRKVDSFDEDIKAVTYHEAEIIKNKKGNLETLVVFDI